MGQQSLPHGSQLRCEPERVELARKPAEIPQNKVGKVPNDESGFFKSSSMIIVKEPYLEFVQSVARYLRMHVVFQFDLLLVNPFSRAHGTVDRAF